MQALAVIVSLMGKGAYTLEHKFPVDFRTATSALLQLASHKASSLHLTAAGT